MHLGVLASREYSDCVVAPKSWHGGDEHDGFRWPVDAQGDRVAGIWDGAGKFVARRTARTGGDGAAARRRGRLRGLHFRAALAPVPRPGPRRVCRAPTPVPPAVDSSP